MAKDTLNWLHISDLHAGKDSFGNEMLAKNLIGFLKRQKDQYGREPDLIFFTGDIANKGKPSEYNLFNTNFLLPLIELYGDTVDQRMFFVPGNHDVDRNVNPLILPYPLYDKYPTLLDDSEEGLNLRMGLVERFSSFRKALPTTGDLGSLFGPKAHFVRTLTIKGLNVGVLGINTSWFCYSDHDKRQLSPGRYVIQLGLEAIAGCDIRIVLGHHPTNWFMENEHSAIDALFARYNVIYLHGHLHENLPAYLQHGADEYLDVQAGAIFDARESVARPNTIIFTEVLRGEKIYLIEPFKWNPDNQEWALSSDGMPEKFRSHGESVWNFPFPSSKVVARHALKERSSALLPKGWLSISRGNVTKWTEASLTAQQVLSFFDGRPPSWNDAASIIIPYREIVGEIVNDVIGGFSDVGASVFLITGPSGEGKSTVLRQVCCAVMRRMPDTKLIYRNEDDADLPSDFVLNSLEQDKSWLIVADEASGLAQAIHFQAQILKRNSTHRIVFLLASRDTDWIAKEGRVIPWADACAFKSYLLRGINIQDALHVVKAWGQYGKEGLQKLSGLSMEDAAKTLVEHSQLEEEPSESAFLGAMLRVRYGKELHKHIDSVLGRLQLRGSASGVSLLEAFAAIVAMHKLGLKILTKTVLARYLFISEGDVRRMVLNPLGDEATVSSGGNLLLTRHRAIAEAAYTLLEGRYEFDFCDVYKKLVSSALILLSEGRYMPNAGKWRYASSNLMEAGLHETALRVGEAVVGIDPANTFLIVHLAFLQRQVGRLDLALLTFRSTKINITTNRAFFTEWGAAEQQDGSHFAAIWLSSFALRDIPGAKDVDNEDALMAFSQLLIASGSIYKRYNLKEFLDLSKLVFSLADKLPFLVADKDRLKSYLLTGNDFKGRSTIPMLNEMEAILLISEERARKVLPFMPSLVSAGGFDSLKLLILAAENRGS